MSFIPMSFMYLLYNSVFATKLIDKDHEITKDMSFIQKCNYGTDCSCEILHNPFGFFEMQQFHLEEKNKRTFYIEQMNVIQNQRREWKC